jgi:hypothetical protein
MKPKGGQESVVKPGWAQSITSQTAKAGTDATTGPDLHPDQTKGKCVSVRFRGSNATWNVDDAIEYMKAEGYNKGSIKRLSVGLLFVDKPGIFVSLGKEGVFHLFHYLEFLVVSYTQLHRLASVGDESITSSSSSKAKKKAKNNPTSLSRGSPSIRIPWIYTPMLYKSEICGVAGGINCIISDIILHASSSSSASETWETNYYGLESNDNYTRSIHSDFTGQHARRKRWSPVNVTDYVSYNQDYEQMQQATDAVLLVSRNECNHGDVHKMWMDYIDDFPADAWHADVMAGLGKSDDKGVSVQPKDRKEKIIVGYVDRQNTRRTMPEREHEWLVGFLSGHPMIDFLHLHMEDYTPLEQIRVASECDVLIGVHGNGLSHVLWMQPERYVVEIYWQFPYQFDYMTASQLMRHNYLGLFNGRPIDSELVRTHDKSLRSMPKKMLVNKENFNSFLDDIEEGRKALMDFLQKAMIELDVR